MKWIELSVTSPPEFVEPLSYVFHRYGHGGVAIEEPGGHNPDDGEPPPTPGWVTVRTYIPLDSGADQRRNYIDVAVRLIAQVSTVSELRERVLEEEEWERSWREHFQVLHVGSRFAIVPTWREYEAAEGEIIIDLDPGMAFGTGHHPTTSMCLEILGGIVAPDMDVLDLGCGSGILTIASAKLGARTVLGIEIDETAAEVARSNLSLNGVGPTAKVLHGTLPHTDISPNSFDVAVANISARVISETADELVKAVRKGGVLVLSGIIQAKEATLLPRLAEAGIRVDRRLVDGDWVGLVAGCT